MKHRNVFLKLYFLVFCIQWFNTGVLLGEYFCRLQNEHCFFIVLFDRLLVDIDFLHERMDAVQKDCSVDNDDWYEDLGAQVYDVLNNGFRLVGYAEHLQCIDYKKIVVLCKKKLQHLGLRASHLFASRANVFPGIVHNDTLGIASSSLIVNADVDSAAGIVDTKLATISTPGKVLNSATTATNLNTVNSIVSRDGSGNFSAGTITANLIGSASNNVLKSGDTMTGALVLPAGTVLNPSLQFTGSTNTGFSSPSANTLSFDINGVAGMTLSASGLTASVPFILSFPICNQAIQAFTVTANNQSVVANSTTSVLLLQTTANRTGLSITFPSSPVNGQYFTILLGATFSITVNNIAPGGASIVNPINTYSVTVGQASATYFYYASTNTWYRERTS